MGLNRHFGSDSKRILLGFCLQMMMMKVVVVVQRNIYSKIHHLHHHHYTLIQPFWNNLGHQILTNWYTKMTNL
ncbi:hypothetical protein Hanom_Chr12g01089761 [Helianthus anomalus]